MEGAMKKIIPWIIGVMIALLVGYLIWIFFFKTTAGNPSSGITNEPTGSESKKLIASAREIFDYWINKTSGEAYYATDDGEIFKIGADGTEESTGSKATGDLSFIKPSTDGSSIIVAFGFPQSPTFAIYNVAKKSWQALPAGTSAAAWDPKSNNRIVYIKENGAGSSIALLTLSNQKSEAVLKLNQRDLGIEWPSADTVYLAEKPSAEYASSLWSLNLKNKTLKTVASEEHGLLTRWFPNGALKFSNDGSQNSFEWIKADGRTIVDWGFTTLPSKCFLTVAEMYCAIPRTIEPRLKLPDAYLKHAARFNDTINKIDLINADYLPINVPLEQIDADRLEVYKNELFFINRYDNKLYELSL